MVDDAYEVDADSGNVGLGVGVVGEPQEQARLADTGVTDEQELEEIVVSGGYVRSEQLATHPGRLTL